MDGADPEVAALLRSGWDPVLALRIARRPAPPDTVAAHERPAARALLDPWLGLAGSTAGADSAAVSCGAPCACARGRGPPTR